MAENNEILNENGAIVNENGGLVGDDSVTDQYAGLPLGLLICQPILEVAKGQMALCQVYLDTVFKLAFKDGDPSNTDVTNTNVVDFKFTRLIIDPDTGLEDEKDFTIHAPLISLVPLPAFTMNETTVDFSMEIHNQTVDTSNTSKSVETTASMSFWRCKASITGKVAATTSHTRTTDNSSKYIIHASAVQQAPSEGMAKLTSLFAEAMEPINMKQGS